MKKGFTLIEILAVVVIIGLVSILVIPKITNSLKNKKSDVDTTTNNIVLTAAKNYINNNLNKFDKVDNNIFCLPLTTLTRNGYLDSPVKNVTDDKDITNSKSVKITYNKGFKYQVVDKKECSVAIAEKEPTEYTDANGKVYKRVSYIKSTGIQYINTGFSASKTLKHKIEIDFQLTKIPSDQQTVMGHDLNDVKIDSTGYLQGNSNYPYIGLNRRVVTVEYTPNSEGTSRFITMDTDDGQHAERSTTYWPTPSNITIFTNSKYTVKRAIEAKVFRAKIYSEDVLVRDYVPVVDSNYVACLFDKVGKKCYYNSGGGSLVYNYKEVGLTSNNLITNIMSKKNNSSINVYNNGNKKEMYAFSHSVTDQTPALTDYRYIGDSPYNYVQYDGKLWRIVGVSNVVDTTGNSEERIKLVRVNNVTGNSKWSDSTSDISWENSNVKQLLNTTFYNAIPGDYKDLIETTKFYIAGDVDYYDVDTMYNAERGSKTVKVGGSPTSNNWIGKVGLLYPSDYGYTFAYGVEDNCFNSLGTCGTSQGSDPSKSWMFNGIYSFFMTACTYSNGYIFSLLQEGNATAYGSSQTIYNLYPTIYLSRNANYITGDGSYKKPYVIYVNN